MKQFLDAAKRFKNALNIKRRILKFHSSIKITPELPNQPKMPESQQLTFFHSLDFPGRTVLYVGEIAQKLGISRQQVVNLMDCGELGYINVATDPTTRPCRRVPVESYRNFIVRRIDSEERLQFLRELPVTTRLELIEELKKSLKRK